MTNESWNELCDDLGIAEQTEKLDDKTHLTYAEWAGLHASDAAVGNELVVVVRVDPLVA